MSQQDLLRSLRKSNLYSKNKVKQVAFFALKSIFNKDKKLMQASNNFANKFSKNIIKNKKDK